MMEPCSRRFTAAEGGARLAATAAAGNTLVTECGAFVATRLLHEEAYHIRGPLSSGSQRSLHVGRAANVPADAHELSILTDLKVAQAVRFEDVADWRQELETKEVVVCTPGVCRGVLERGLLDMARVNVMVIDSCHAVCTDEDLQYIMKVYKQSEESKRPRILAITYPIFTSPRGAGDELHADLSLLPGASEDICDADNGHEPETKQSVKELGVHVNLDDFAMYEKLEYKIDQLEDMLCCRMDLAEDIDGCKRISGPTSKPKEVLIEYEQRPSAEHRAPEYTSLEQYMRDSVREVMDFLEDHRHDPTEIYGEDLYEEFKNIPDPTVEPRQILKEFIYILDQLGPYGADKAAFSLLIKLEKLKIKVPYERHFLLLRLCTTTFVKIRCQADSIFNKYDSDWDKIRLFSTPKLMRLVEILEQFTPADLKTSIENNTFKTDSNDRSESNINNSSFKEKMLSDIDKCDFSTLKDRIEDKLHIVEGNLKDLDISDGVEKQKAGENNQAASLKTQGTGEQCEGGAPRRGARGGRRRGARAPRSSQASLADSLCGLVYVAEPLMAKILFMLVVDISRSRPSVSYISCQYCAVEPGAEHRESRHQGRRHEEVLKKFRMHECNLLLTTSALEEGIDLPRCNLVLRWDEPPAYRSYVLSRSRARAARGGAALLAEATHADHMLHCLATYKELDQIITRKCGCGIQDEPPSDEESHADTFNCVVKPYTPADTIRPCACSGRTDRVTMQRTISDSENDRHDNSVTSDKDSDESGNSNDQNVTSDKNNGNNVGSDKNNDQNVTSDKNNGINIGSDKSYDQIVTSEKNNDNNILISNEINQSVHRHNQNVIVSNENDNRANIVSQNLNKYDQNSLVNMDNLKSNNVNNHIVNKIDQHAISYSKNDNSCNNSEHKLINSNDNEYSDDIKENDVEINESDAKNSDLNSVKCSCNRTDGDGVASVDLNSAIALINRYCAKLPSDTFTRLAPQWWTERVRLPGGARDSYICTLRLPLNCPVKFNIVGHPMATRVLARRVVALQAVRALHAAGELDHRLAPVGKETFKAMEVDGVPSGPEPALSETDARPGTTKRRQYYYKRTAWAFTNCEPVVDTSDAELEPATSESTDTLKQQYTKTNTDLTNTNSAVKSVDMEPVELLNSSNPELAKSNPTNLKVMHVDCSKPGLESSISESMHVQSSEPGLVQPNSSNSGLVHLDTSNSGLVQPNSSNSGLRQPNSSTSGLVQPNSSKPELVESHPLKHELLHSDFSKPGCVEYDTHNLMTRTGSAHWNSTKLGVHHSDGPIPESVRMDSAKLCLNVDGQPGVVGKDNEKPTGEFEKTVDSKQTLHSDSNPESVQSDSSKPGLVQTDCSKSGLVQTDCSKPGLMQSDCSKPGLVQIDSAKLDANPDDKSVSDGKAHEKLHIGEESTPAKYTGTRRNMLYAIECSLWCALPERYNTRGRRLHAPQNASQALAILMAREEPTNLQIPAFPVYTRSGEVRVSVQHVPDADVRMSPRRGRLVRRFMRFVFSEVLRVRRRGMALHAPGAPTPAPARNDYYIVPTVKTTREDGTKKIDIDWAFLEQIYNHTEQQRLSPERPPPWLDEEGVAKERDNTAGDRDASVPLKNPLLKDGEVFVFDAEKYREAVVTPWYRNQDQPQFFLVAEICSNLTPDSAFPSPTHDTFRSYYRAKYKVELTQPNQPLLDVDHTSARLNLLTPRYVNRKGVALPVSSERTRRAKRDRLDQKQILVPELCTVHPFAAPLWFATVALPCVLYRINALLIADEIRRAVAIDVGLGVPKIDDSTMPGFRWPPLDFGWCLAEVLNADAVKADTKSDDGSETNETTEVRTIKETKAADHKTEDGEKTINEILQEAHEELNREDAESGFEIGTWSNDMASSIPDGDDIYDEWSEPLPPNLTFCTSANGGVNWCDPVQKPKCDYNATRAYTMADSDCSYMSSDFDSDDSDLETEGTDTEAESGFGSSKAVNASLGVRIEYKSAHEAEAVDVEVAPKARPAPTRDPRDEVAARAELAALLAGGGADHTYIDKFHASVESHKHTIVDSGLLVRKEQRICPLLPESRDKAEGYVPPTDDKLHELFPYEGLEIVDGQISVESIERNKRRLLCDLRNTLSNEEVERLHCFYMKDVDIDDPSHVNEKVANVGFDTKDKYVEMVHNWRREYQPYYEDCKGQNGKSFDFDYQPDLDGHPGPSPSVILQALTMSNANDGINLERLETIGDSFLKFAITSYLYCAHPGVHEGKLSHMRSKQVSNLNLYRLGRSARLGARMIASKFEPHDNWLPPCHRAPPAPRPPRATDEEAARKPQEAGCYIPYNLITQHSIPDKSIADCVEALIGAYLLECGPRGALLFMSWLGISVLPHHKIPLERTAGDDRKPSPASSPKRVRIDSSSCYSSEAEDPLGGDRWSGEWGGPPGARRPYRDENGDWYQIVYGSLKAPPSPLLRYIRDPEGELERMLSGYEVLEETLGYRFRDRSLLLQALTHASHQVNTLTDCYQRLEFLGDAILDYLITRHLYEDGRRHSPGALTDLRSALVNNTIFATLCVRHGFHKYFRHMSPGLNEVLLKYVRIQEENGHSISEEHYLIQEDELEQAEDVEVPKALGDLFESIAGAIFLDSGMSLGAVWESYERLMGAELEAFSARAPKSPVRELLEAEPDTAKFSKPERLADGRRVRVCVEVFGRGTFKGVGRNYRIAKGTAARCALRHLRRHRARR